VKNDTNRLTTKPVEANRNECTRPYTFDDVYAVVTHLREAKKSFRFIAKMVFGDRITFGTVQRIAQGKEPHDPKIRAAIGIQAMREVEPAPGCTIAPGTKVSFSNRVCPICQEPFLPHVPNQTNCGPDCAKAARRARDHKRRANGR
jgi:hypothetical protein